MSVKDEDYNELQMAMQGKPLARILASARPHWAWMLGFIVTIALTAALDSTATWVSKFMIDEGVVPHDLEAVKKYAIQYGLLYVANSLSIFLFIFCAGRLGEWLQSDLREKLFAHLQRLSFSFFDKASSGWLLSRITSDTRRISELASWMFLDIIWGVFNIVTALIFMATINWQLALVVLIILPLLLFSGFKFKGRLIKEYRRVRSINSQITSSYAENINGLRVIKGLGREDANLRHFDALAGRMYAASYRAGWLSALFMPTVQLVTSLGVALILWFGGWELHLGDLTLGGLRAFIAFITFMLWPIEQLSRVFSEMQQSLASAERVYGLIDSKADILELPGAQTQARFTGAIELKQVNFHYKADQPVLRDFNLRVAAGERIAIVGPTGGGKTTLVSLISRYYEPVSGRILFDGEDYRTWTQEALQSRLGVVLQTPQLFSGTVAQNIAYGRLEASQEEIEEAARKAAAHQMILDLPKGYQEEVGQEGGLLSMGQRQLVSLARAILADPDIIIMDEATSSVDTLTEGRIQEGMASLFAGRTSFVIAHRLSTIREADRILVIQDGRIAEEGNHQSLLAKKGYYHQLYTSQFRADRSREIEVLQ